MLVFVDELSEFVTTPWPLLPFDLYYKRLTVFPHKEFIQIIYQDKVKIYAQI